MDVLPIVLSLSTRRVERLHITRTIDLRPQRRRRFERFALGARAEDFQDLPDTAVYGHIGFRQSLDAVVDALGFDVDRVEERPLRVAVVATEPRSGDFETIEHGQIAVVRQGIAAFDGDREVIALEEYFGFIDEGDDIPRGDTYVLDGVDQQFTVSVSPGVHSFMTTPAVIVNMVVPVVDAAPGLRTMMDFTVRDLASKGQARAAAAIGG
jgi:hypothetical protein